MVICDQHAALAKKGFYEEVCPWCEIDALMEWKNAVTDAAVIGWTYREGHSPREAINALLCMERRITLDPAVSTEAKELHDTITHLREEVEKLREENDKIVAANRVNWRSMEDSYERAVQARSRAEAEVERLREDLRTYGECLDDCDSHEGLFLCSCGYRDALRGVRCER